MNTAKKIIHNTIYDYVASNNGVTPLETINHTMQKLAGNSKVYPYLERDRVSGCIAPHVTHWQDMYMENGLLYTC